MMSNCIFSSSAAPVSSDSALHRLCTSSISGSRRWRYLRPFICSTSTRLWLRPTPWAPRAPSGLMSSSRHCRCQLLLASCCQLQLHPSVQQGGVGLWQGREVPGIKSEVWLECVTTERDLKLRVDTNTGRLQRSSEDSPCEPHDKDRHT